MRRVERESDRERERDFFLFYLFVFVVECKMGDMRERPRGNR